MIAFREIIRAVAVFLIFGIFSGGIAQQCISFVSPVTGEVITTPVCSLLVEKGKCSHSIRKVEFQARFFTTGADTPTVVGIGSVSRPPYSIVWNLSDIPNQYFSGASFYAEATLSNGEVESARREGVFFLHQKVDRLEYDVPFAFSGTRKVDADPILLPANRPEVTITAAIYWNEKELVFIVNVRDPKFTIKASPDLLAAQGIEILLDPLQERKPFPGKDVFLFAVPLSGKPYRIMYKPVPDDSGSFTFLTSTSLSDIKVVIKKKEQQGFSIYCPLPAGIFGNKIPEKLSCNLVAKTLDSELKVKRTSWIKASLYDTYSPYIWGELKLIPRSYIMNRPLFAIVFFGIGFLLTLLVSALVMMLSRPAIKNITEQSDEDRQQFTAIREVLDSFVVANVSIDAAAKALNMTPRKLGLLLRRTTGMTFQNYMMYARIEIAKERLRSSHCTEETIALACGFHSPAEMEKFFIRFHRQTPAKFRAEHQVV
jgi:AraC-like DNA-binding protein